MTDPQSEPYEPEGMPIDHGLSVSAPPQRQIRRNPRQAQGRDLPREPVRSDAVVRGREGEILTRKRVSGTDPFHIDPKEIPRGWDYQWNAVTVWGNKEVLLTVGNEMYQNGWRPVPAERHPGKFTPAGQKGEIIFRGMRLEERPLSMTIQAREEDQAAAMAQMRDRDESLMGHKAGLRKAAQAMGVPLAKGQLSMSIDRALDIPAPEHRPADDSVA
jgi:hypothetical protein